MINFCEYCLFQLFIADEIAVENKRWCAAMEARNADDLADLYTTDAKLYNCPGCQPETGKQGMN